MNRTTRMTLYAAAASLALCGANASFAANNSMNSDTSTHAMTKSDSSMSKSGSTMKSGSAMKSGSKMSKSGSAMKSGTKMSKSDNMKKPHTAMKGKVPTVGGAPMYPSKTIVENASKAKNLTTLVSAVKEADLVDTLSGSGPFTVFAPTNKAFDKLPKSTVSNLMKPANKDQLKKILTYHVVPGKLDKASLEADLKKGNGSTQFKTVEGDTLTIKEKGGKMTVTDGKGNTAKVMQSDVEQSNGTVYVIGSVLQPS